METQCFDLESLRLSQTLSLEEEVAYDEHLLNAFDSHIDVCFNGRKITRFLRFWQTSTYAVVVGRGNDIATEVRVEQCDRDGIPIIRRCSGGGTVLQGPGCLNYALIQYMDDQSITVGQTNKMVMGKMAKALGTLLNEPIVQGITDLTLGGRKFMGNAQKRKRKSFLFHGCFLLGLDISKITTYLAHPSREPDYRRRRSHHDFLINLDVSPKALQDAIETEWL